MSQTPANTRDTRCSPCVIHIARDGLDDTPSHKSLRAFINSLHPYPPGKNTNVAFVQTNQASSAQGIELFEDLLWDLASLSFIPHVFQPSLTLFPASAMDVEENPNGTRDVGGGTDRNFMETQSEASVSAQLVSAVTVVCPKNLI